MSFDKLYVFNANWVFDHLTLCLHLAPFKTLFFRNMIKQFVCLRYHLKACYWFTMPIGSLLVYSAI